LTTVNHFLRDFRTNDVHTIDPGLPDLLHSLTALTATPWPFQVISGYRSPATNAMLRQRSEGIAAGSLHMTGLAIDIRLADVPLAKRRTAAIAVGGGGGYHPASDSCTSIRDECAPGKRNRRAVRVSRHGGRPQAESDQGKAGSPAAGRRLPRPRRAAGRARVGRSPRGGVSALWRRFTREVRASSDPLVDEWSFSKAFGWTLRLKERRRALVHLTPCESCFIASFALG
jgi:hypothetical protein